MRPLPLLLCLAALAAPVFSAEEIKVVRVWPGWKDAEYFGRISEYFTNKENESGQIVLRSQPVERSGFYFLTRIENQSAAVDHVKINLDVISPGSPLAKTYTFDSALSKGQTIYQIGLTGSDWPNRKAHPQAWRLVILGSDGSPLLEKKSFLWEVPA